MKVAGSEAGFLAFVQGLMRHPQGGPVQRALVGRPEVKALAPLGPTAATLLQRLLARGLVRQLAWQGGSALETRPTGEVLATGRLWGRRDPPPLHFSGWTMEALQWAYLVPLGDPTAPPAYPKVPGLGDRLIAWQLSRAYQSLDHGHTWVAHEPLAALQLAGRQETRPSDWASWLPEHGWLLEATQIALAHAWAGAERQKRLLTDPREVVAWVDRQRRLLHPLLDAAEAIGRADLLDFWFLAGRRLVPDPSQAFELAPQALDLTAPLRERTEAVRQSAFFGEILARLELGLDVARHTRFFEDGYEAAQARLVRWERYGPERAQVFRQAVAPLSR